MDKIQDGYWNGKAIESLSLDDLEGIAGGVLPDGWQQMADSMAPALLQQYKGISYEDACKEVKKFVSDPDDYKDICEYIKKYF